MLEGYLLEMLSITSDHGFITTVNEARNLSKRSKVVDCKSKVWIGEPSELNLHITPLSLKKTLVLLTQLYTDWVKVQVLTV